MVDDHVMRVSHVFRGRDWAASLPKHALLRAYLGFAPPACRHLPLLCTSKRAKLSKAAGQLGLAGLVSLGLMPQPVLTYLASLIVGKECADFEDAVR